MFKFIKIPTAMRWLTYWPPYLGAGVRVTRVTDDVREIDVEMRLHFWNKNYVGTQFGGSLSTMADPWYMLMLLENLGRDYVVWDKAATIRFKSPGTGTVYAKFVLTQGMIDDVKSKVDATGKTEPTFQVQIVDGSGKLVAEVDKVISVKRKDRAKDLKSSEKLD